MAAFIDIQRKFVRALLRIPGMDDYAMRSSLLQGLPLVALVRSQSSAQLDLNNIINGLESLGRLNDEGGTRPLIVVAENALGLVTPDGEVGRALDEVIRDLNQFYGGDFQPATGPVPPQTYEALVFGRQRDTRLPFGFIRGAERISRGVACLSVPRIFDGVQRGDEAMYGTGWLIATGLLITNHHVVDARDRRPPPQGAGEAPAAPADFTAQAAAAVARFDYHREGGEHVAQRCVRVLASDDQLDYAILQLEDAPALRDRPVLPLISQPPELVRGSRLNIAQHSGGGPLRYAIRNNFYVRQGERAEFLLYQTDTEGGASGSPVCDDYWQVVALHHASTPVPNEQVPQEVIGGQPIGVTVLNEAIAIHAILNDLPAPIRTAIRAGQGWPPG